jgi:excisionase family DNA binding protein
LTTKQVADLFHVSPSSVSRWVKAHRLEAIRTPGGGLRFRVEDVSAFLKREGSAA